MELVVELGRNAERVVAVVVSVMIVVAGDVVVVGEFVVILLTLYDLNSVFSIHLPLNTTNDFC